MSTTRFIYVCVYCDTVCVGKEDLTRENRDAFKYQHEPDWYFQYSEKEMDFDNTDYLLFPEGIVRDFFKDEICATSDDYDVGDFDRWLKDEYTCDDTVGLFDYALSRGFTAVRDYTGRDGKSHSMRDNLLVTFGCRAGAMDASGLIDLPCGSGGEDDLAIYADHVVGEYLSIYETEDVSFDEHIETALHERYGKEVN